MTSTILTLNAGSSSIKFALFEMGRDERRIAAGSIDRIGLGGGTFRAERERETIDRTESFPNHDAALKSLFQWLAGTEVSAVGHRIVQGGPRLIRPVKITTETVDELRTFVPLAPNHLPGEIAAIEAAGRAYPELSQVACFDTAFHRAMPELNQRLSLPRGFYEQGILRYGFHGLSYEYIVGELSRVGGPQANGRVVIAHLGNGASMAAVLAGKAVDTTMGLTPIGGLVMGTRTGDLDPGVILYLLREGGMSIDQVEELVSKRSGLLGVSGTSSDMKDLLATQTREPHAAEAVEMFCRQARKFVASMAAALGGIDTLVFTGGIGEHAAEIRERIAGGLGFLGITLDPAANAATADIISSEGSVVVVRVMKTNEELIIARHTASLLPTT